MFGFEVFDEEGRLKLSSESNIFSLTGVYPAIDSGENIVSSYTYSNGPLHVAGVWLDEGQTATLIDTGPDADSGAKGSVQAYFTSTNCNLYSFEDLSATPSDLLPRTDFGLQVRDSNGKTVFDPRRVPLNIENPVLLNVNQSGGYSSSFQGSKEVAIGPAIIRGVPRCAVIPDIRSFFRLLVVYPEPYLEVYVDDYTTYVKRVNGIYYLGLRWSFTTSSSQPGAAYGYKNIIASVLAGTMDDPFVG